MTPPRLAAVALVLCLNVSVAIADDNTIPGRFTFKFGGDPIWISASEAITPSGALSVDVQRPEHLKLEMSRVEETLERRTASSDAHKTGLSCDVTYTERFDGGPDDIPVRSLSELVEVASTRTTITGVLSATAVGIHDGIPYTVLQIDAASPKASVGRVYLMYASGQLRFDDITVCNMNPAFAKLPAIGDPITFVASAPIDTTGTLYYSPRSWVFYEHQSVLVSPPALQQDPAIRELKSARAIALQLRIRPQHDKQR